MERHRLSGRRMPARRTLRRHQASRDRRPRHPGDGGRADRLRDRRSDRLSRARRRLRFFAGTADATGHRPRAGRRRKRPAADAVLQGERHVARRLSPQHDADHRRPRGGGQGAAHRRSAARPRPAGLCRPRLRRFQRDQYRAARRRAFLWPACPSPGDARGRAAAVGPPPEARGARAPGPRGGVAGDLDGAGHDRLYRRPAGGSFGDPAFLVPAAEVGRAGRLRSRRGRDRRPRPARRRHRARGAPAGDRGARCIGRGRRGCRPAVRARPWPQRRQGQPCQYRDHRPAARARGAAARPADPGGRG